MPAEGSSRIYSATYSNVPVYEFSVNGDHVMRRRSDDWINATHILKVAEFDKPQRTRILEREVQKGVHEKVQGGYGKYQGTWIPLPDGKLLAERNKVFEKLRPIFDFVPGDRSPPPAPKHATAAASKPRAPRQSAASRKTKGNILEDPAAFGPPINNVVAPSQISDDVYDGQINGDAPDNETIATDSLIGEDDMGQYTGSRKRKRGSEYPDTMSLQDQQHQLWADDLLDYFMLLDSDHPYRVPPEPPSSVDVNRHIDEKGHTALHWAAAMGDILVVKDLMRRGARIDSTNHSGETPLMRAVMFTNNFDKKSMSKLFGFLQPTVTQTEWYGSTVFHHIAATTQSKSKYQCARYYLDTILNKLAETWPPQDIKRLLDMQDHAGDTSIHIAARFGARKCVRALIGRNPSLDTTNAKGATADDEIRLLNDRHINRTRQLSSSPFQNFADGVSLPHTNGNNQNMLLVNGLPNLTSTLGVSALMPSMPSPQPQYRCEAALSLSQQLPHLLLSKAEKLAQQLDAEVAERDMELVESERLLMQRQEEVDTLRLHIKDLEETLGNSGAMINGNGMELDPDEEDESQRQELENLTKEAESLIEHEQRIELDRLLEAHGPLAARSQPNSMDGDARTHLQNQLQAAASQDPDRLQIAKRLAQAQQERQQLVREVVQGLAAAGMGERQLEYKRLIMGALNLKDEDVETMLPDILKELEEATAGT
ncbi:MAG: hypothetical protein M1820_003428 [Bogoriella megaspora]|nr:MAG: hypothetical protein M1820_003428 [Bogoriella megaspora]